VYETKNKELNKQMRDFKNKTREQQISLVSEYSMTMLKEGVSKEDAKKALEDIGEIKDA
jgi:hypothetical protein